MSHHLKYELPADYEILEAYLNKQSRSRSDAKRIKRALRKLSYC